MTRILGIDIGDDAVRGTWLDQGLRRSALAGYVAVPIAPSIGEEERREAVRQAVHELFSTSRHPPDAIVACMSGDGVSLRIVDLPAKVGKDLGEVLRFELESVLPFDLADAVLDHQNVHSTETQLRVLSVSVPKTKVATALADFAAVGVEPRELAVGAPALDGAAAFVPELEAPGPVVMIHLERAATDVCFLEAGRCAMARTLTEGTELLERGAADRLSAQLKRTLAGYRAAGGEAPTVVYLSGPGALLSGVTEWLAGVLEVDTRLLPLPPALGADEYARPAFARSAALVGRVLRKGRRFNLRRGEFAPPRAIGGLREHARLLATCAALVFASFLFSVIARNRVLASEHEALEARLAASTRALFGREARTAESARTLMSGGTALEDPMPRFDAFDALDAISSKIAPSIRHSTQRMLIEVDDESRDGRFEIYGQVPSITDRDTIAAALEEHDCVTEVERGPTTPAPNNQGQNYRLEGTLQCPGELPLAARPRGAESQSGGRRGAR